MNTATAIKMLFAEEHVSASALGSFIRCPRAYRYRYVDRRQPETKASALAFGTAIHKALAYYYEKLRDIDPEPIAEELAGVFREEWGRQLHSGPTVLFGEKEDEGSLTDLGAKMLEVFTKKVQLPAEVLEVEMPFSIEIVDPATGEVLPRLVGVLDAVVREKDRSFRVLEHKSSARRYTPEMLAYHLQTTTYSLAAPQLGFESAQVTIQLLLKQKTPDLELYTPTRTPADHRDLIDTAVGVLRAVRAGVDHPIRDWHCRGCEYASACVAG